MYLSEVDNPSPWCHRQVVAPLTFKDYCDTALVETWVQQCLVGQLKPGQVLMVKVKLTGAVPHSAELNLIACLEVRLSTAI